MGTGITSILLHDLPYQFKGLKIISYIVFGLNVVLFLLFLGLSLFVQYKPLRLLDRVLGLKLISKAVSRVEIKLKK